MNRVARRDGIAIPAGSSRRSRRWRGGRVEREPVPRRPRNVAWAARPRTGAPETCRAQAKVPNSGAPVPTPPPSPQLLSHCSKSRSFYPHRCLQILKTCAFLSLFLDIYGVSYIFNFLKRKGYVIMNDLMHACFRKLVFLKISVHKNT